MSDWTYRGHTYRSVFFHPDEETGPWVDHYVLTPEGRDIGMDYCDTRIRHSEDEFMTETSFQTWVDLGCPSEPSDWGAPFVFSNRVFDRIREAAEEHSIDLTDPAQHDMLKVIIKLRET